MTPLQQTCGEMLLAQDELQDICRKQLDMNAGRLPNAPKDRATVYLQQAFYEFLEAAASKQLPRFAANDNTMVVGAA